MTRLLDTNICVFLIRKRSRPALRRRFDTHAVGELAVSSITESELRHGAERSNDPPKNHHAVDRLLLTLPVLPYGSEAAAAYGAIRARLAAAGTPIGSMDLLIAAHALAANLILVTNNTREFKRVPGLRVENWGR